MKKYKVWLHIEEIDDDEGVYEDIEEHTVSTGHEFNTAQEAIELKETILEFFDVNVLNIPTNCECDNTHKQNNTVCRYCWDNAEDACPICQSELIAGPNGCTICSKDGCSYWRE